jgi:tetratricopeptide (TPR) repeat protein
MNAVNGTLLRTLYPSTPAQIPAQDLPQNHNYARILRDVERGIYNPVSSSRDFIELVLPSLVFYPEQGGAPAQAQLLSALADLQRAAQLNPASVLPPFLIGIIYERSGRFEEALEQYARAWALSSECYPAALAMARIMDLEDSSPEAVEFLSELAIRFPDNLQVKRQLAIAYYKTGDWSRAEPAIAEILQRNSRDGEFILMRAHIMVEQGQFAQAQAPLDTYATINANDRLYLYLRARVQFEGFRNRDAALNYLRSLLRNSGGALDDEASVYAARLLMESTREADQTEGRNLLTRLLDNPAPSLTVITLAMQDAMRRQVWYEASDYLERLLSERRSSQDLLDAYTIEKEQGNNAAALSYARELYERDTSFDEAAIAYITALIDTGRSQEATRIIDTRLRSAPAGASRSRYYYLQSRTRSDEEEALNDLRSSLFEDPRNLNAIIAMFEIYHRRRDERRAVYYLKQALALAPNNPLLRRYEIEYAPLL